MPGASWVGRAPRSHLHDQRRAVLGVVVCIFGVGLYLIEPDVRDYTCTGVCVCVCVCVCVYVCMCVCVCVYM